MNNFIKKEICTALDCVGCGVCVSVCPQRCISMEENKEGFLKKRPKPPKNYQKAPKIYHLTVSPPKK